MIYTYVCFLKYTDWNESKCKALLHYDVACIDLLQADVTIYDKPKLCSNQILKIKININYFQN